MQDFVKRVLIVVLLAGGAVVIALLASEVATTLLLVFGGILLAVFLNGLAHQLIERSGMRYGVALAIVVVVLLGILGGVGYVLGPNIAEQMGRLTERIPQALQQLEERISSYEWGQFVLARTPDPSQVARTGGDGLLNRAGGTLSKVLSALVNVAILIIVGLYLAVNPELYRRGALYLVPRRHRDHAKDVLDAIGHALRYWLIGRFASMAVVGVWPYGITDSTPSTARSRARACSRSRPTCRARARCRRA